MNTSQHFGPRIIMFICGIACMTFGIALSCKAYLGTSPISSVPLVLSMCTPLSVGIITIIMNFAFIAVQPLLLRAFYWRELIGQVILTVPFGYSIDLFMWVLQDVNPETQLEKWAACLISIAVLAFGVFLEVRARIFFAAGEGLVNVLTFISGKNFSLIKNGFDITLVVISVIISLLEFSTLRGVGLGTIAAAVLVGRMIYLYEKYLHFFKRWKVKA